MLLQKNNFLTWAFIWTKNILVLCFIGAIIRLLFFLALSPADLTFSSHGSEILNAFERGFRFDLSAISYITILLFPFIFFKKTPEWISKIGLNLYRFFLFLWIGFSVFDIIFYSFYTDRINLIAFGLIDDDTTAVAKGFWKNYPAIQIFLVVFLLYFIAHLSTRLNILKKMKVILNTNYFHKIILFIILCLFGRGTLSLFPLGPDYAVISNIPFLNQLSFGTAHSIIRAAKLRSSQSKIGANSWDSNLNEFGYGVNISNREDKAFEDYFDKKIKNNRHELMTFKSVENPENKKIKNVVLVVMESWGGYGFNTTSDFDLIGKMKNHLNQDYLNLNFLSNTPGTAGSLSCLLAGVPQRAISPFLTESSYLQTPLSTSPALTYKKQKYETHFLYGGNPGWRDINKYAMTQGFDFIEGELEVKKTLDENHLPLSGKHDWGIYDEDLFKYINIKLNEKTEINKLYVVMTTTNHPPFELPPKYDQKTVEKKILLDNYPEKSRVIDHELAQKRFKSFRYSSDALADFLTSIKNSKLKYNTIIAATGDHSSWLINFNANERFTKDSVPFYIYIPDSIRKSQKINKNIFQNNFGGHMDIWPTLYNLSLYKSEYESFGVNMFLKNDLTFSLNNSRLIANSENAVFIHNSDQSSYFSGKNNLYETTENKNLNHQKLEIKYKSLMGVLDAYLNDSKKK